ncbi:hypothetical protein FH972_022244 [Carpinus fangiana]|uniref:Uncharacterized protein n=1 Tax=Carpinus fangiana TaxID=176857 RepID=A0A5N6KTX0_9ROSI|nr:hypothetical protein FH972_022244 [Carpinus fangiana]
MAEVDINPQFGAELKDGFKPVNAWVAGGIEWLDDIQQFYRERSVIEKEYATKLAALAKKYFEKKARKQSTLSVGDTPTETPGSLESASMTTWTVQLSTLESRAAEHDRFSNELVTSLADPLKTLNARCEELRKQHADYAAKLEKERDASYGDLKKIKGKYDGTCQDVENRRKKVESAYDSSKQKAQSQYQQQLSDMHNAKNTYLISINVTNKQKERYYHEYVPDLLDSLQDLSESRIAKLNRIWSAAAQIETQTLTRSTEYLNHLSTEIPRNNPLLDSMMFVRHNAAPWQDPQDFAFEPSPVWHDDDAMMVNETAKVFLRNILSKSKGSLGELRREVDRERREVEKAKQLRQAIREGRDQKDEIEASRAGFTLQEQLHDVERRHITADVEVSSITAAVGDISIGARAHNFKGQTFKIPTNCDLCGERIWGLSAKGFDCKDCGFTCHSKCEMKVPADCPGETDKEAKKKLKAERQEAARVAQPVDDPVPERVASTAAPGSLSRQDTVNSMNTLSSGYAASANRSVSGLPSQETRDSPDEPPKPKPKIAAGSRLKAPPPAAYIKDTGAASNGSGPSEKRAKMLYAYQANGADEISVAEDAIVVVVEADDGSGWMKVRNTSTRETGLVPAAYAEALPPSSNHSPSVSSSSHPYADTDRPESTYSASSASLAGSISSAIKKKQGPAVAPKKGAKKLKHVEALYAYEARTDAEHSMAEGERFVLINRDAGDGWADVEKGGRVGSVPANYLGDV